MKDDSILSQLFSILFKVLGFCIYLITKLGEHIIVGFNTWLSKSIKNK